MKNRVLRKLALLLTVFALTLLTNHIAKANEQVVFIPNSAETGKIIPGGKENTYLLPLEESGTLTLSVDSRIDITLITLEDMLGNIIYQDKSYDGTLLEASKWIKSLDLEKGTYLIKISDGAYIKKESGIFTVTNKFIPAKNQELEPNNAIELAKDLKLDAEPLRGFISLNDTADFFKVELKTAGKLKLNFSSYLDEVNISLFDGNGKALFSEQVKGGKNGEPSKLSQLANLEKGTYFIGVEQVRYSDSTGVYTLQALFGTVDNETEPKDNVGPTQALAFLDVADRYKAAVDYLVANKITQGFSKTEFGVYAKIKRVDAAVLVVKALNLDTTFVKDAGFKDVPARAANAVNILVEKGIMEGESKTIFGSDAELTRGEMALILSKAYKLDGADTTIQFNDVSDKYSAAVKALVKYNITQGTTETLFGTSNSITRGDMAIFIHRVEQLKK
ncbi:S-layer homology domain-containing protein [Sporosarcina thermotolerans]|uniref:S-layer homology domain-containing protein n=1 Tax=Sporosarcina thermotolerans TaxID=633404 RepID=A0AAW9A894_9BACL|nr:S-layer homology domain-containing protein [Sporosarcina thermotolerans]MDW0116080.1 S-layer homology domain-containing protein [Sporosarcina thermotolerans]WHT48051.1 S-layer homology domain-containing protein [Sporosarcina thermotolerans]